MRNLKVRLITRTAILLALTVVFQMLGRLLPSEISSFVVGPLVNTCLLVATGVGGLYSGIIIAVLAPFTSLINNHAALAPVLLLFAPFIAIGNIVLVVAFKALLKKNKIAGIITGAFLKFIFLWGAIVTFVNFKKDIKPKQADALVALFSFPQLVTALIGGIVALIVITYVQKQVDTEL